MIPSTVTPCYCVGEIQVSYKPQRPPVQPPRITMSRVAYEILMAHWSEHMEWREEFYILLLNRVHDVTGVFRVSEGGISGTCADPRVIFQVALGVNASYLVLAHNHPSGDLTPSAADRDITRRIKEAGKVLEIIVLDHLILTPTTYLSFADDGLL